MVQTGNVTVGTTRLGALDTDFGDNPLGRLGPRSVQQQPPGSSRLAALARQVAQLPSLLSRAVEILSSPQARAERGFRRGLQEFSRSVGDLLGALSAPRGGAIDATQALQGLTGLADAAKPLTSRGASFDELLDRRLSLHLGKLSDAQLEALVRGIRSAEGARLAASLLDRPETARTLMLIEQKVNAVLMQRAEAAAAAKADAAIHRALARLDAGEDFYSAWTSICGAGGGELSRLKGLGIVPSRASETEFGMAVMKERLANLPPERLAAALAKLPTEALKELAEAKPLRGEQSSVDALVQREVQGRAATLEKALADAAEALSGRRADAADGPRAAPRSFAREVAALGQALRAVQAHHGLHGLAVPEAVDAKLARAMGTLLDLNLDRTLPLDTLTNREITELHRATAPLGLDALGKALDKEITSRREELRHTYRGGVDGIVAALGTKDAKRLLEAMSEYRKVFERVRLQWNALGGKAYDANTIHDFQKDMNASALAGRSQDERRRIFDALSQPDVRALVNSLSEISHYASMTNNEGTAWLLHRHAADVELLRGSVADTLEDEGVTLPETDDPPSWLAKVPSLGFQAIAEHFGIKAGPDGVRSIDRQIVHPQLLAMTEQKVPTVPGTQKEHELTDPVTGNPTTVGLAQSMVLDLPRSDYVIAGQDRPLIDREAWGNSDLAGRTDLILQARERLLALCNGNREQMLVVSKYANQAGVEPMFSVLYQPQSPVRLPDGSPCIVISQNASTRFTLSEHDGVVRIRYDHDIVRPDFAHTLESVWNQVPLHSDSNIHLSYEISIDRDGTAWMSEPVTYQGKVIVADR